MEFAARGRGIPATLDHPKQLVVTGLYQYVRNPMYVGVLLFLLGEALFFGSWRFLVYAIGWLLFVHCNVLWYEEPNLRRKFGRSYEDYTAAVHRWIPEESLMVAADRRILSPALLVQLGAWGALMSALGASFYLAVAPVYSSTSASAALGAGSSTPTSAVVRQSDHSLALAAVNGPMVFVWFGFTMFVAALPLLFRRSRFARPAAAISAGLLLVFVILGSASIGGFYVPATAFALLAAAVTPPGRPTSGSS